MHQLGSRFIGGPTLYGMLMFFPGYSFARCKDRARRINGALALFEALASSKEGASVVGRRDGRQWFDVQMLGLCFFMLVNYPGYHLKGNIAGENGDVSIRDIKAC